MNPVPPSSAFVMVLRRLPVYLRPGGGLNSVVFRHYSRFEQIYSVVVFYFVGQR